jgi:hypothetical protein
MEKKDKGRMMKDENGWSEGGVCQLASRFYYLVKLVNGGR